MVRRMPSRMRSRALLLAGTLPVAVALLAARAPHAAAPEPAALTDAVANDHRAIAGAVRDGEYVLELEMRRTIWRPNASDGLSVDVPAFAEVGAPAMLPGPLVRVPAGTRMRITVRNALAQPATVHGLHDHRGPRDSVVLAPGETRTVRFDATVAGTFAYFARTNAAPTLFSRRDDSQLVGAFIVDRAGADPVRANARERILVMTAWDDSLRNPASPYGPRQVYAINGRSWPFTERLTYDEGDSVRWRVLNLSQHSHPMHLHGTFFRVQARGMPFADTAFDGAARLAVTESLGAGATMSIAWVAERPGNWLFHCHLINHIDEALRLGDAVVDPAHTDHGRVTDMMAGLVSAITVRPASARPPRRSTIRRRLRLVVTERPAADRGAPSRAYVLQRDAHEPAADSIELPGSTLDLRQGEPTAITVVNRGRAPTAVHWHGMELESLFDGVAGWSGSGATVAPIIAPGDSFVVRMTPPRAGTFIYHTHAGERAQLTAGLYGALIVHPRDARAASDERVIVLADSTVEPRPGAVPPSMINGRSDPLPIELEAGRAHRLRFIVISAITLRRVRLLAGDRTVTWTPVAKDGAEFVIADRVPAPADVNLAAGETFDVLYTPTAGDALVLEVSVRGTPVVTRVPVRVRAAAGVGRRDDEEVVITTTPFAPSIP